MASADKQPLLVVVSSCSNCGPYDSCRCERQPTSRTRTLTLILFQRLPSILWPVSESELRLRELSEAKNLQIREERKARRPSEADVFCFSAFRCVRTDSAINTVSALSILHGLADGAAQRRQSGQCKLCCCLSATSRNMFICERSCFS